MAGCSNSGNGFGFGYLGGGNGIQSNGFGLDFDLGEKSCDFEFDDVEVKKRSLFDLFLPCFWKEFAVRDSIRPIPVMLDEKRVDLFKLFIVVREKGGYEFVSKNGLWGSVAKELGLDLRVSASVKLVYCKYLNDVENWLRGGLGERESDNGRKLGFLSMELQKKFRGFFADGMDRDLTDNGLNSSNNKATSDCLLKGSNGNELSHSDSGKRDLCSSRLKRFRDDDEKVCGDDPEIVDRTVYENGDSSRKRKRLVLPDMLNWVAQIAKSPRDPSVGAIPEPSKWKEHQGNNELWIQAVKAREALFQKIHTRSISEQSLLQDKQKMHPAMYEEDLIVQNSPERSRTSSRVLTSTKTCPCSCCKPPAAAPAAATEKVSSPKKNPQVVVLPSSTKAAAPPRHTEDVFFDRHISIGPSFQAEVPEWTGKVFDSDDKWLGTRVWPPEAGQHVSLTKTDSIGGGNAEPCDCFTPGSVECNRFHIAENRMKLKLQLGPVFYRWGFHRMGEEVSLRWTEAEQKRFKRMVQLAAESLDTSFWGNASRYFRGKTREDLVSYYFNVFGIQRRSYQNRVTPGEIDSDNDEEEFGCIGQGFGLHALEVPGEGKKMVCSQNNQCFDLA